MELNHEVILTNRLQTKISAKCRTLSQLLIEQISHGYAASFSQFMLRTQRLRQASTCRRLLATWQTAWNTPSSPAKCCEGHLCMTSPCLIHVVRKIGAPYLYDLWSALQQLAIRVELWSSEIKLACSVLQQLCRSLIRLSVPLGLFKTKCTNANELPLGRSAHVCSGWFTFSDIYAYIH